MLLTLEGVLTPDDVREARRLPPPEELWTDIYAEPAPQAQPV